MTSGEPITRDMTGEEVYAALYSMRSSRLEPGVFWTGSNDGPVWVTRDNGKTWKNVTPAGLPPGGRVHTIEDSPHRKGSAYVSVYRMYLNDFKPYLYMTNDYGEHWTLLTDGTNGIPVDQPMHVVREDPEQEGSALRRHAAGRVRVVRPGQALADAAAESAGNASDRLQGPPRRSARIDHGRAFWILDNVSPLRQIAASVTKPTRTRPTDIRRIIAPGRSFPPATDVCRPRCSRRRLRPRKVALGPAASFPGPRRSRTQAVRRRQRVLFTPRLDVSRALRAVTGRPDLPSIRRWARDRLLPRGPSGEVKLDILDGAARSCAVTETRRALPPAVDAEDAGAAACRRRCRSRSA